MMNGDDIRNLRAEVEKTHDFNPSPELKQLLAFWVIAEQLFEIRSSLETFLDVVDPSSSENFPGYIRVRINNQENT